MKKKFFRRGKAFYSLLGLLVLFTYVPTLIALLLTQKALSNSHETLNAMLGAAQETQLQYIQQVSLGRNHTEQVRQLREHDLLQILGQADSLDYSDAIVQAEEILLEVTPESEFGEITTCLYFVNSNYLIDSNHLGGNARSTVSPITLSGLDGFDLASNTDVARVFFYRDSPENDNVHSIYTACVFPNVVFIFDIYMPNYMNTERPDVSLIVNLAASLEDVEICYYDSYGNFRNIQGGSALCSQYSYETIGPESDSSFSFWYDGHAYLCSYTYNEDNMSKFALFCRDEIAEEQHRTTILIWVSGGILLVVFLTFAIYYARRTYRPIGSLMKRLNSGDKNTPPFQDEFAVLNQAIDSFDAQLSKRDKILSKYYLLRVLRGQRTDVLETYQDDWFVDTNTHTYAVAALHVDEFENGNLYDEAMLENAISSFLKKEGWDSRTVSDGDFLYLAFRLEPNTSRTELLKLCQRIQEQLSDYCLSIFISDIHASPRELRRCYSEAMSISEYYIAHEQLNIIADGSSIPANRGGLKTATPDFSTLHKLSDCIVSLSAEDAFCAFDSLTAQLARANRQSLCPDSPMYNLLVNTIALALYDMGTVNSIGQDTIQQEVTQIRNAESVKQLRSLLADCLQTMSKRVDGQEYNYQRFEKIRDYILTHYADPNLDSASTAALYQMSPSTVTRLFKKYNNTGFLEFVHQTRVNKATELLQTTDLPISEISTMVGYTNAATMNRAFKAHANATPGMIRKAASK